MTDPYDEPAEGILRVAHVELRDAAAALAHTRVQPEVDVLWKHLAHHAPHYLNFRRCRGDRSASDRTGETGGQGENDRLCTRAEWGMRSAPVVRVTRCHFHAGRA